MKDVLQHLHQAPRSLTRFQQNLQLQQPCKKNSAHKPGTDKLAAAMQKPAAKKLSAQSVMAAQSSGRGGRSAAAGRDGNHGAAGRGRSRGRCRGSSSKLYAAAAPRNLRSRYNKAIADASS
ncbi:TPA: hypothetical protein ACH3X1_010893 [Trebouxia sp. C0004]